MLNGWGGYLVTGLGDVNAFFSHDEYIDYFARREADLAKVEQMLGAGGGSDTRGNANP